MANKALLLVSLFCGAMPGVFLGSSISALIQAATKAADVSRAKLPEAGNNDPVLWAFIAGSSLVFLAYPGGLLLVKPEDRSARHSRAVYIGTAIASFVPGSALGFFMLN